MMPQQNKIHCSLLHLLYRDKSAGYIFKTIILGFIFIFQITRVDAQNKSRKRFKEVVIRETRVQVQKEDTQAIDSTDLKYYQHESLRHLLELRSNVFVKNYGVSSLSTISIRGSSAAQTFVEWQGVPINSAMTGLTDLSILPSGLFDKVEIQYGSQLESNGLSGGIKLSNSTPNAYNHQKASISIGYESLKNADLILGGQISNGPVSNQLKINVYAGQNRFQYYNPHLDTTEILEHAQRKHAHLLNDLYFKISPRQTLSYHLWVSALQRNIPKASFESLSQRSEQVEDFRNLLKWQFHQGDLLSMQASIGWLHENYQYRDSAIQLYNRVAVAQMPWNVSAAYNMKRNQKISVQVMGSHAYLKDQPGAYITRGGFLVQHQISEVLHHLSVRTSLQKEFSNRFELPWIVGLNMQYVIKKWFFIYGSLNSQYRAPTLNELYYFPGGNLKLQPEKSKSMEGGIKVTKFTNALKLNVDLTGYNRQVKDWIAWYGNAILTPHNIQKVLSHGIELTSNISWKPWYKKPDYDQLEIEDVYTIEASQRQVRNKMKQEPSIYCGALYAYTISTTEESYIQNDYSIGKQIPYVPRYQLKVHVGFSAKGFDLQFIHAYTGYRFVTTDESQYLKPYQISNVYLSYSLKGIHNNLSIFARLNNVFDTPYEGIIGRVMPGRNAAFGLSMELH